MDVKNLIPSCPIFYFCPYMSLYLQKNTGMGHKTREGVTRLFLWDPIFIWDEPVFILYFQCMWDMANNYMSLCYVDTPILITNIHVNVLTHMASK
jgi:hypothetical protein